VDTRRPALVPPRRAWVLLVCLGVAAVAPTYAAQSGPLVLVVVDTLRADHLPCYGYGRPTAPAMCALAADGVLFEHAYTPRTATTPAIASMLTGLYPHRHGVRDLYLVLPQEMTTLAEVLRAAGYHTGGFVSSFVMIDDFSGLAQGFDEYDDDVRTPEASRENFERSAANTVDRALRWLARAGPHSFLFLHLIEPHGPYTPRTPYREQFALPADGVALPEAIPPYQRIPGLQFVSDLIGRYDGEIATADAEIARMVAFLRQQQWYGGATIVLVADHGESMGEEGQWFAHGHSVNDAEAHVPLIIKFAEGNDPPLPGTRQETEVVSLVDVFPTLLAAAGVGASGDGSGSADLRAVARGAPRGLPPPLTELRSGDGFLIVGHGRECSVRWKVALSELTPDLRIPDPALAAHWHTRTLSTRRFPPDSTPECEATLVRGTGPLMTDLFTFRLHSAVASRAAVQNPGRKAAFVAGRQSRLTEGDREALRRLGYLQ